MVWYSNESMFGIMDKSPPLATKRPTNITAYVNEFVQLVGDVMQDLAADTARSSIKYATKEANFTSFLTVYAEAQCTPDLSSNECLRCLINANDYLPDCCYSSTGARVLTPSCNVRYELFPFYVLAPPPPNNTLFAPHSNRGRRKLTNIVIIALVALVAIVVVLVFICISLILKRRNRHTDSEVRAAEQNQNSLPDIPCLDHYIDRDLLNAESLQYDLKTLQIATNYFSYSNKIGEGGFGDVYVGILPNGQEVAVKRLSVTSSQGAQQFMNEVVFVAKLQHRNLVRLLGFSMEGYEKLLVYEFVPNKSLDLILFDPERQGELDWPARFKIIRGIARGMLYLHEDSRLRIIHRDLKASNILLDAEMNPKISDFGTARKCKVDESESNTSKIAGTFGYMAPEYMLNGEFSVKSDVYSFGVLVLEIVSGRRSTNFRQSSIGQHLLTHAWKHWTEGRPLEVMDPSLGDSYSYNQVVRCVQLGLLCVQGASEDRPTMASINCDLNSNTSLPEPPEPGFMICNIVKSNSEIAILGSDQSITKSLHMSYSSETSTE